MEDGEIIDEALVNDNSIHIIPNNVQLVSKGTVKIQTNTKIGSGFFLKIKRNNKPFYCLLTNQHIITKDMVDNKENIKIIYDNEKRKLDLSLNITKRIIVPFEDFLELDITLVEIIKGDEIKEEFYLLPDVNHNNNFLNKNIEIVQYPKGKDLSFSVGTIKELDKKNKNIFYHSASTTFGSSGSPIFLEGGDKVLAIHRGTVKGQNKNIGIFIRDIINMMVDLAENNFKDSNEVNNNINNNINQFSDLFENFVYGFSVPLVHKFLNIVDGKWTRCHHLSKSHTLIENTNDIWQCSDCSSNDNICSCQLFNE